MRRKQVKKSIELKTQSVFFLPSLLFLSFLLIYFILLFFFEEEEEWFRIWLLRWLSDKESSCQCRRCSRRGFNPCIWKIPLEMATHASILAKPHGQKSLAGYHPWGYKELDTTKWLICIYIWIWFKWRFYSLNSILCYQSLKNDFILHFRVCEMARGIYWCCLLKCGDIFLTDFPTRCLV